MSRNDTRLPSRAPMPETGASRALGSPMQPSVVYTTSDPDSLDAIYEGQASGYSYAREGHPNADRLASMIDGLEGGQGGVMQGSGMAAVTATLMGLLQAGDHIVASDQLYGRSLRMITQDLQRFGITHTLVDPTDIDAVTNACTSATKLILVEVVSNPTIRVADMPGIMALAKERGITLAVDNTFTTPLGYPAYQLGADVVIHSVTKLMAGHSDATLGYTLARDPDHRKAIYDFSTTTGLTASPFDCWLAERGLYTFELRLARAQSNAAALADALGAHPKVEHVLYPGRDDHPDKALADQVLTAGFGNMVSFRIHGGRAEATKLTRALDDIAFAPTLGDVSTTLSHPASSSHRGLTEGARLALGITEGFFRVSVGVEPEDALIASFETGLAQL